MSTTPDPSNPYGSPQTTPGSYGAPSGGPPPTSGLAIASMVLGIVSVVFGCCWCTYGVISIPSGIAACIMGFIALNQINSGAASGKGMAIAGLVCGGIGVVLAILFFVLVMVGAVTGSLQDFQNP